MHYQYAAISAEGKEIKGKLEALSDKDAIKQVRSKGLMVTQLRGITEKANWQTRFETLFSRISPLQRVLFTRHLALLLKSGVAIEKSMQIIIRQQKDKSFFKKILEQVLASIRAGETLAGALGKYPSIFNPSYMAIVEWGETSGTLDDSLDHLATQLEHDHELMSKIRGALMYPAIIVFVIAVVGVLMVFFVLPRIVEMIQEFNVPLPLPTRIFISFVDILTSYGIYLLPLFLSLAAAAMFLARSDSTRSIVGRVALKTPLFGKFIAKMNLARMNRALASLINSGIPIADALVLTADVVGNAVFKTAIRSTVKKVQGGTQVSVALAEHKKLFPPMQNDMVQVGEESGQLVQTLNSLADFYEREVKQFTNNISQLIEPILLVVVGLAVGVVVFAVIMPIYQLGEGIV